MKEGVVGPCGLCGEVMLALDLDREAWFCFGCGHGGPLPEIEGLEADLSQELRCGACGYFVEGPYKLLAREDSMAVFHPDFECPKVGIC